MMTHQAGGGLHILISHTLLMQPCRQHANTLGDGRRFVDCIENNIRNKRFSATTSASLPFPFALHVSTTTS